VKLDVRRNDPFSCQGHQAGAPSQDHPEPLIDFDNLGMTFDARSGPVQALKGVSFSVHEGEFVSVVGPSVRGKSTLLRLIAGLIQPTVGTVRVAGADPDAARRSRRFGFVFQSSVMLPWRTAMQNVALPCEIIGSAVRPGSIPPDRLLEMVGLSGYEDLYPRQLSGGMRQRVAIARALSFDPPILLMDEPFGALDALTRQKLHGLLLQLWERNRKTVVFITHDVYEAVFLSNRVLIMSGSPGRVEAEVVVDLPRPRGSDTKLDRRYVTMASDILGRLADH
jgi:NitT/TauT family transport system ATP-binding protein